MHIAATPHHGKEQVCQLALNNSSSLAATTTTEAAAKAITATTTSPAQPTTTQTHNVRNTSVNCRYSPFLAHFGFTWMPFCIAMIAKRAAVTMTTKQ